MRRLVLLTFLLSVLFIGDVHAQSVTIQPAPSAPGTLIDIGGYRLNLYCLGEGSPTVILEPGFARFSLNWRATQIALASDFRVCTYDHAGFGWSEAGEFPRTAQQLSDELAALLQNSDEPAPYLIVAHSLGGFVARIFASQHADMTAGVILLDATPPAFLNETIQQDQFLQTLLEGTLQTAETGDWNPQSLAPIMTLLNDVPQELQSDFIALATNPTFIRSALSEWENRLISAEQATAAIFPADLPLTVLVAGERLELESDADALWIRLQAEQAALSAQSEYSFVIGGDHNFYIDHLDGVRRAIQRMIIE